TLFGPCLTPDGKILVGIALDREQQTSALRLWDVQTGKLRGEIPMPAAEEGKNPFRPSDLTFYGDGKVLAVWGYEDNADRLRLWDFANGKELPLAAPFKEYPPNVTLAPNAKVAAI